MSIGDLLAQVQHHIETTGWFVVGVAGTEDDPSVPFSYSIGFQEHDHPELIIIGLPPLLAHRLIGDLYDRVAAGERFSDGQMDSTTLRGYDVVFQAVPPDGHPLNLARRYYGTDELPALHVVWPDKAGRFPGDEGFDPKFTQDLDQIRREAMA